MDTYFKVQSLSKATKLLRPWTAQPRHHPVDFAHLHCDHSEPDVGYYVDIESSTENWIGNENNSTAATEDLIVRKFSIGTGRFDAKPIMRVGMKGPPIGRFIHFGGRCVAWTEPAKKGSDLIIVDIQTSQIRRLSTRKYRNSGKKFLAFSPDGKTAYVVLDASGLCAIEVEADTILWTNPIFSKYSVLAASEDDVILQQRVDMLGHNRVSVVRSSTGSKKFTMDVKQSGTEWVEDAFFLGDNRFVVIWMQWMTLIDLNNGALLSTVSYSKTAGEIPCAIHATFARVHSGLLFVNVFDWDTQVSMVSIYDFGSAATDRNRLIRLRSANKVIYASGGMLITPDLSMILASAEIEPACVIRIKLQ
jgi:hypothetical protein